MKIEWYKSSLGGKGLLRAAIFSSSPPVNMDGDGGF
jgi:hypothetical protein